VFHGKNRLLKIQWLLILLAVFLKH